MSMTPITCGFFGLQTTFFFSLMKPWITRKRAGLGRTCLPCLLVRGMPKPGSRSLRPKATKLLDPFDIY